jgi:hypothetical protein
MIAHQLGVLKLGNVSLDGTKVKANASKHHALSWQYACALEKQLAEEVEELLRQAEEADQENVPDGMNIPEEIARRENRLGGIAKAKAEIQKRAAERYAEEQEGYEEKVAKRTAQAQATGKTPRGREPGAPKPGAKGTDQVNLTDSESRIMPTSGDGFEHAYNAQAAVDMDTLFILTNHVSQQSNDKQELELALEQLGSLPETIGAVAAVVGDAGYCSEGNVKKCEANQITPYLAGKREKHHEVLGERFAPPEALSEGADEVTAMKYRLKTIEGRKLYSRRKCTVEPVFGIIKAIMGLRQFLLRGLKAVSGEWNLVCLAWNLKRLHRLTTT